MIEDIETVFKIVAERFNLPDMFAEHTGFYKITGAEVEFISGMQNSILKEKVYQQISLGGTYGFYLDTKHLEVEEFIVAIGLHQDFLPFNQVHPSELVEMIILHEIVHLIEMQGLTSKIGVELTECDMAIGEKIEKHLNKYDSDIVHTKEFIAILNQLIRRVHQDNYTHKLRVAMSKTLIDIESDILEGADEDFYDCKKELNKLN